MTSLQNATQLQLRQMIEQIERLEEEKRGVAEDIRDKYAEAKAVGFDPKIMRQVVKLRRMAKSDRDEADAVLATYLHALGMADGSEADFGTINGDARQPEAVA